MDINKITEYLDELVCRGIPSVDCIIYENHSQIYRHMNGTTDSKKETKIQGNELYLMFSMTKVQTMTALMQLVEKGEISLEDQVSKYLPAYENIMVEQNGEITKASNPLRIKHLVSMQSGLDYDLNRAGIQKTLARNGQKATTLELVNSFIETPLKFSPGDHFLYSLSHDVVAAIIEVVTNMRFGDYLKKYIWEPLQMEHTFFAKPMNILPNLATQFMMNEQGIIHPMPPSCEYQLSEAYESGGAGLISSTKDYAIFADTLSCGGESSEGVHILKSETIELIKQNLLGPIGMKEIADNMGRKGYGYGCGMQVLLYPEQISSKAPLGVFGWDGAAGSCIIMDTKSKRSLVYTQHVRNCGMAYSEIHPRLRDYLFS